MILPFSTQLNGKPTYFPEKILSGMLKEFENKSNPEFKNTPEFIYDYGEFVGYHSVDVALEIIDKSKPKLHTIREDKKNRWQVGYLIDFYINTRKVNMFQFAPRVNVQSIQDIEIVWSGGSINVISIYIDDECFVANYNPEYNSSTQRQNRMELLAQNDGFDSVEDFMNYFNTDFKGKLIHWTDLKY